jgi:ADP-ribose pyrophosphatase YjhB (NUDIX family)
LQKSTKGETVSEKWLEWSQQLQSIAQAGIEYSKDPYDLERFQELRHISAEIIAEYTDHNFEEVANLFANETGYQTPKVDVRAAVFKNETILLVQENDMKWSLPGGWAEPRLSVKENVIKEVREEAGIDVIPESVIAILDRNRHADDTYPYSVYKIFIHCKYVDGSYQENIETNDAGFFHRSKLPAVSELRTTVDQIQMCFDYMKSEGSIVLFD